MPRPRFPKPDSVRLEISDGDWVLVKKRLNAGEDRAYSARMVKSMPAGQRPELDPLQVNFAQVAEYLLDWSLTDDTGAVMRVRGESTDDILRTLRRLDIETFNEIAEAIQAHEAAMTLARAEEKKPPAGATAS